MQPHTGCRASENVALAIGLARVWWRQPWLGHGSRDNRGHGWKRQKMGEETSVVRPLETAGVVVSSLHQLVSAPVFFGCSHLGELNPLLTRSRGTTWAWTLLEPGHSLSRGTTRAGTILELGRNADPAFAGSAGVEPEALLI